MPGRANSGERGPDTAWLVHCRACAALVEEQMEIVATSPGGAKVDIWRCTWCGSLRSCRKGWRTRCMVCVDDRTVVELDVKVARKSLPELVRVTGNVFEVKPARVTAGQLSMVLNHLAAEERVDALRRPGWTVLATDVHGLPFYVSDDHLSHGTWAVHDICGAVAKITAARPECPACPPEPGSRTHRARAEEPHLLYLVRYLDLLKFGHGDVNRVRAHVRAGCRVIRVLRGSHAAVVSAELTLKRRYRDRVILADEWDLPLTFGTGSEVVEGRYRIDIRRFLTGDDVQDVTDRFRR
jgi:hypothetical protein